MHFAYRSRGLLPRIAILALIAVGVSGTPASAAKGTPVLGRSVAVSTDSGTVLIKLKRSANFVVLTGRKVIPVGSTIDTTHGMAHLATATPTLGKGQAGDFNGGAFIVTQRRSGLAELTLTGGRSVVAVCGKGQHSPFASAARGSGVRRLLHGHAPRGSRFSTSGTYAAATIRGTTWTVSDRCEGTKIDDLSGHVATTGRGVPLGYTLDPGMSIEYRCASSYCASVRSADPIVTINGARVQNPAYYLTLLARTTQTQYSLSVAGPSQTTFTAYNLGPPNGQGYRRADLACVPDQGAGDYLLGWRLSGALVASLTYTAPAPSPIAMACTAVPFSRGTPGDLTQQRSSAHFVVHYSNNSTDPSAITDSAAAQVLQIAEQALSYETGTLGMPTYVDGGGGKVDIYVEANASRSAVLETPLAGQSQLPSPGSPTAAYIVLPTATATDRGALAGDVFGVLADGLGRTTGVEPNALLASTSAWASANFTQSERQIPTLSQPVDCSASCPGAAGSAHWRFYQHLAERFGLTAVRDILSVDARLIAAAGGPHMDGALQQILGGYGSSLSAELSQYALKDVSRGWMAPWVAGAGVTDIADAASLDSVSLDPARATIGHQLTVSHLSSRYLQLTVPPSSGVGCYQDTVTLDITPPTGGLVPGASLDTPANGVQVIQPSSATQVRTPSFDSCSGAVVRLPLVNGTTSDGLVFTVTASTSGP